MFYVCIDHLSDEQLEFFGFLLIKESDDFKLYRQYDGTEHIIDKNGRKFVYVSDLNDAIAMQAGEIVHFAQN